MSRDYTLYYQPTYVKLEHAARKQVREKIDEKLYRDSGRLAQVAAPKTGGVPDMRPMAAGRAPLVALIGATVLLADAPSREIPSKRFPSIPGSAEIYLYRPYNFAGSLLHPPVICDDSVARIGPAVTRCSSCVRGKSSAPTPRPKPPTKSRSTRAPVAFIISRKKSDGAFQLAIRIFIRWTATMRRPRFSNAASWIRARCHGLIHPGLAFGPGLSELQVGNLPAFGRVRRRSV